MVCIIFKMYCLSRVVAAHKRDTRCLDYHLGRLLTGGSDKLFNVFGWEKGEYHQQASSDITDSEIICAKINKIDPQSQWWCILGCKSGKIMALDAYGNPSLEINHDSNISSVDFIDAQTIVTGSWDGKAIVWSLATQKKIAEYVQGKYAVTVFYNKTSGYVVSGSQDKALSLWDPKNGDQARRIENAHNDIIREIADVEGSGMIVTCSNDETVKLWSAELELIQSFTGHSAFVFAVKALRLGSYISGGEDKTLKVWGETQCVQDIHLPASIWSLSYDENGDIFVACSDGYVRVFTTDQSRRADPDTEAIFNKAVVESASKKSGMSEEQIKKMMTTQQMRTVVGKKNGEVKMFRNGMVPQVYSWTGGQWTYVGQVVTEGGGAAGGGKSQPRYYQGDKYFPAGNYDYIFDVDDDSGMPKVIPFNDGDNPLEAAEKYCHRQGISKGHIQQIRRFLLQNSNKAPRVAKEEAGGEKQIHFGQLKCTPSCSLIEFNNIKNPQALINKLKEFNERAGESSLTEKELAYIENIAKQLENEQTYHSWKLDFKELDALKKALRWPRQIKLPVWDMLRAYLKHYQSEALFSGLEAGRDIITQLSVGLESQFSEGIYALILKTLSNALIQNTNKGGMLKHAGIVFGSLTSISKRGELQNANYLAAFASLLYNYSIACYEKSIDKEELLVDLGDIIRRRLELDSNPDNRSLLLQAGANILYKYHKTVREKYQFLLSYLQADQVSADIKVFY